MFQSPAHNFPNMFFGKIELFRRMPYLLPTMMGAIILFLNAILGCFLSWDGGVRGGQRLQLEVEKDEPLIPSHAATEPPTPGQSGIHIKPGHLFTPAQEESNALEASMKMRRESLASLGTAYG